MKQYTRKSLRRQEGRGENSTPARKHFEVNIDPRKELLEIGIDAALQVMTQQFLADVEQLCGPRYQHRKNRKTSRGGTTGGEVVLGGRKISIRRPRVIATLPDNGDGRKYQEIPLPSYRHFQQEDPLAERILEQILVGVSMRQYPRSLEGNHFPLPFRGLSKSAISRRFVLKTWQMISDWLSRPLDGLELVALYFDGVVLGDHTVVCALGVDRDGKKHILGLWEGSTENQAVCQALVDNLMERGLKVDHRVLVVIDGSRALRKVIKRTFGDKAVIQRCQRHKRENVKNHLPKGLQTMVDLTMRRAYRSEDIAEARRILTNLIRRLEGDHPGAAASLKEGLEETLTVIKLGVPLVLRRSLQTTNVIESSLSVVRQVTRNVKYWRDGRMVVRWVATGLIEAEKRFRRIKGYRKIPILVSALERWEETLDRGEVA
jgi:transposase-like protein